MLSAIQAGLPLLALLGIPLATIATTWIHAATLKHIAKLAEPQRIPDVIRAYRGREAQPVDITPEHHCGSCTEAELGDTDIARDRAQPDHGAAHLEAPGE
ncbi:hypothetical protein STSO111631_03270 [Stackebrandtia soli]